MIAVITGASRGIGKAVAEVFALNGYDLLLSSRSEEKLLTAIEELKTKYPNVSIDGKAMDLGRKENCRLLGEWILENADTVDVLVNNAGNFIQGNVSDEPDGAMEQLMNENFFSAYHLTRLLLPRMMQAGSGHVFTISSIAALGAYPGGGAYSISKAALLSFTRNLRFEMTEHGIKLTAVLPGATYTDSWRQSGLPEERFMTAADVAHMIFAATKLSPGAVVEDIIMRPQLGDI